MDLDNPNVITEIIQRIKDRVMSRMIDSGLRPTTNQARWMINLQPDSARARKIVAKAMRLCGLYECKERVNGKLVRVWYWDNLDDIFPPPSPIPAMRRPLNIRNPWDYSSRLHEEVLPLLKAGETLPMHEIARLITAYYSRPNTLLIGRMLRDCGCVYKQVRYGQAIRRAWAYCPKAAASAPHEYAPKRPISTHE